METGLDLEALTEAIKKNLSASSQQDVIVKAFGDFAWFVLANDEKFLNGKTETDVMGCRKSDNFLTCRPVIIDGLNRARDSRHSQRFTCDSRDGFCFPIAQGDRIYGFLVICRVERDVSEQTLAIFSAYIEVLLRETQKELELKKLYETIRPRAIALSTVHTLHRLISSTLDLNELLPRLARLTLQVMRANRCSIKLVDSKKKALIPKATVDLRQQKAKLKKIEIGKWAPGKAVKFARSVRGADYLAAPLIDEDVIGVITVYDKLDKKPFTDFDEEIMRTLCEQAVIAIKNAQLYKEQERLTMGSIKSIAAILESRSPGEYAPKASFLRIVHQIGIELKLTEHDLKCLQYATLLHDAGQITLPDEVTKKKGVLTGEEYDMIKEHPKKAAMILKPLKALKDVVPVILHHHENWDGTGYPSGMKGADIPIGARIMGVVGAFEAMITAKSYRKSMSISDAIEEIKKNSGKQFDPNVVEAFLRVVKGKTVLKCLKKEIYGHP